MSNHWRRYATLVLLFAVIVPTVTYAGLARPIDPPRVPPTQTSAGEVTRDQVNAALPRLEVLVAQTMERTGVPGIAIAVVFDDEVLYVKGFGVRKVGEPALVDPDTVFQIASLSKPMASTVIARLVGEGIVSWDDHIIEHDPTFAMSDPWVTPEVTLRDMFSHRSGLPDHAGDMVEDLGYDREAVLRSLRYEKPVSSFRSHYAYTNFGVTEAAVAAAIAAGTAWEDLAETQLYAPLGMTSTSSRFSDYQARANRAATHVRQDGQWAAAYVRHPDAQSPAGGVSSSVRDMAQWMRLQLGNGAVDGKQLIAADALAETHVPQIVSNPPNNPSVDRAGFYGLGWNVGYDAAGLVRLGHSGAFSLGAATAVYLVPARKLGVVALTNGFPMGIPETLCLTFLDLALYGEVTQDYPTIIEKAFAALMESPDRPDYSTRPAQPSPALPPDAYTGVYHSELFGDIDIVAENGGLAIKLGPTPRTEPIPMRHWDRDVFLYLPGGEGGVDGLSGVTFSIGPEGKAISVVLEYLDVNGQGTFTRTP